MDASIKNLSFVELTLLLHKASLAVPPNMAKIKEIVAEVNNWLKEEDELNKGYEQIDEKTL